MADPTSIAIYVAGALSDGRGGLGVYCPKKQNLSYGLPFTKAESNVLELLAVKEAMKFAANAGIGKLDILTISQDVLDVLYTYVSWPPQYSRYEHDFKSLKNRLYNVSFNRVSPDDPNHKEAEKLALKAAADNRLTKAS